jgi:hypothetical protein
VGGVLVIGALEKKVFQARLVSIACSIVDPLPNNSYARLALSLKVETTYCRT